MNKDRHLSGAFSVLLAVLLMGTVPPSGCAQPLAGVVTTTNYPVFIDAAGHQCFVNELGQSVTLPGAGVSSSVVQVYRGPMGNLFYIDRTGARILIPQPTPSAPPQAQTPGSAGSSTTSTSGSPSGTTYAPSFNVSAPYPYPYPYSYPYTNAVPTTPAYVNGSATVYPSTTTTYGTGSTAPASGTINSSGATTINTPQGTTMVEHSGQTSYTTSGATSTGSTPVTTPYAQGYGASSSAAVRAPDTGAPRVPRAQPFSPGSQAGMWGRQAPAANWAERGTGGWATQQLPGAGVTGEAGSALERAQRQSARPGDSGRSPWGAESFQGGSGRLAGGQRGRNGAQGLEMGSPAGLRSGSLHGGLSQGGHGLAAHTANTTAGRAIGNFKGHQAGNLGSIGQTRGGAKGHKPSFGATGSHGGRSFGGAGGFHGAAGGFHGGGRRR